MKALREVGLEKIIKYFFSTLAFAVFKCLLFPPLRRMFLLICGARIGRNTVIGDLRFINLYRAGFKGISIGDNVFIGDEVMFDTAERIIIADNVTIAARALILTHLNVGYKDHPLQASFPSCAQPVTVEKGSFIGAGALVLPGVVIGPESFVAAGSVVTADVAPKTLAGGNPAKVLRPLGS